MKKISIIIPVYKVEQFLNRCVDSIVEHTKEKIEDIEIILIDDGSPDKCPLICDEYAEKFDFVKVIHKENGGVSSARNEGMKIATGEYITFVDSDDYVNENFYKIFDVLESNKEIEIFMFEAILNNKILRPHKTEKLDLINKNNLLKVLNGYFESSCNKIFKSKLIKGNKLEFSKGKKAEDLVFSISSILKCKNFMLVDVAYYIYFQNEKSVTHTFRLDGFKDLISNHQKVYDMINIIDIEEKLKKNIFRILSRNIVGNIGRINFMAKEEQKEAIYYIKKHKELILKPFSIKAKIAYYLYKIFGLKFMLWSSKYFIKK
ncbi:MAG: glycosyltransferase [Clostridia bacterium]|nr:glycosyltransferase [Clostridia bacterium]